MVRFHVNKFIVEGENPLSEANTAKILAGFTGKHEGLEGLLAAADALEKALSDKGYAFHRVILPRQTMEKPEVRLEIIVFKIVDVSVEGNEYFSDENIRKSMPVLQADSPPNTSELARSLNLANRHSSKQLVLNMKESQEAEGLTAELKVKDSKPWSVFSSLNNIGSDETGDYRLSVGGQYNNFLGLDHSVTLSYTSSPGHYGEVKQKGFNYSMPLYGQSTQIGAFFVDSDVDSGEVGGFDVSGAGRFWGINATHLLLRNKNYTHEITLGFQDKLFINDVFFAGINLGLEVRSRPIDISYHGEYKTANSQSVFNLSLVKNLTSGSRNTDVHYFLSRFGAESSWQAMRFNANWNYFLPREWLVRLRLDGQFSGDVLIPGEQFGLGGENSIRGFEERVVAGDSGISGNLEIWAPPIKELNNLRLLAFIDGGHKHLKNTPPVSQILDDTLLSTGIGLRWQWQQALSLSLNYGYVLNEAKQLDTTADKGNSKVHFNLLVRY